MQQLNSEKGFSLIEVVVSLGVLGFGILAMFSMQTFAIRGNANANQVTQQATWGADGIEQIMTVDFDDVVNNNSRPDQSVYIKGGLYDTTWTVTPNSPLEGIATIEVEIKNKVDSKSVTMDYMRADPNYF